MNRRAFFGGLFAILPAATSYKRIWKELAKTELPKEALIGCDGSYALGTQTEWAWRINICGASIEVTELKEIPATECPWVLTYKLGDLPVSSVELDMHLGTLCP